VTALLLFALPTLAQTERAVDLGSGISLTLVQVPAGEFTMGAPQGESPLDPDEQPTARVRIAKALWLGKLEVTNQQYALFDPAHNTGWIDTHGKDRVGPGVPMNGPNQPVARISCLDAERFCKWLSEKIGGTCRLPTEAEWEYVCRAGTSTPFSCGDGADLAKFANFADANLGNLKPWAIRDNTQNDGAVASCGVGRYQPNPWGLCDMHGNVCEWTASAYRPYPYDPQDGRERPGAADERAVRGGSWDDLPRRCRSAFRLSYQPTQPVYNVGFRVVVEG
jgi:formylglycine-generating enzyme required for sulfatase activity